MATIPASENEFPEVLFAEGAAPAAPASGLVKAYAKADGLLYSKDDAGAETALGSAAHEADTADAHDASAISVLDTATNFVGTDVEAVLAELQDNIDAVSAGGFPSGTSNPGSPSAGDQFFRTDLGLIIYYDGTRWLTASEYTVGYAVRSAVGAGYTATSTLANVPVRGGAGVWYEDVLYTVFASTAAFDGSNFWVVTIDKLDAANSATNISTVTMNSQTSNNWKLWSDTIDELVDGDAHPALRIVATKTASPGNLLLGVEITYRLVIV